MENKNNLAAAIIKARKKFNPLVFDKQGARNPYATLGAIKASVEEALDNEGVDMHFRLYRQGELDMIEMVMTHAPSGERREGYSVLIDDPASPIKDANQRRSASQTYAMRNLARALLNLHADTEDLDEHTEERDVKNNKEVVENDRPITEKQVALIKKMLRDMGKEEKWTEEIFKKYNVGSFEELTLNGASAIISALKGK